MGPGGWKTVENWWMRISCWGKNSSLWLSYFSSLKMVQKTDIYLLYGVTPISIGSSCLLSWHCHAPGTPHKYGFLNIWHPPKLGMDKTVSPTLTNHVQVFPLLRHKIQTFAQRIQCKPFLNKYASPRINLAMLMNLDANLSRHYRLLSHPRYRNRNCPCIPNKNKRQHTYQMHATDSP